MSLLEATHLVKEYQRDGAPFRAVDDVSLRVESGEVVAIVGRSGSGKTTFLNMIAGLVSPTSGGVTFAGTDILALRDADMSRLRNRSIGFVPQGQSLLANLTVFDNVRLPHYLDRRDDDAVARTAFLLDELGIAHLGKMRPAQLSGGEMRRVAIARAMMNRPLLLIADEPTGDLDMDNIHGVMALFVALAEKGVAVVFSTHEEEAEKRADRIVEMTAGRMVERFPVEAE